MSEYFADVTPVPAPCAECRAKIAHADRWLDTEHRAIEIADAVDGITIEVRHLRGGTVWTTIGAMFDLPCWTLEEVTRVATRAMLQLNLAMDEGLTLDALHDQWRNCLACYLDPAQRGGCYACSYCDEHGCPGDCDEGRYANQCDRADDLMRGYSDEVSR